MPDWTRSMQQTYEYYVIDPITWEEVRKIDIVKTSSVSGDLDAETLGSASFSVSDILSECYVRTYLVTIQDGVTEKHPLGTHLIQTPSSSFNGKIRDVTLDGYTSLMELKENQPPIGYFTPKGQNIIDSAYALVRENARAPVIKGVSNETATSDFVSDTDDTWLSYISDLISNYGSKDTSGNVKIDSYRLGVDELGRILFSPYQKLECLQPRFTYTDDNSSILYPDISMDHDLFGIPNAVEVIYSDGTRNFRGYAENRNPDSPISIVNRGRIIKYREVNPSFPAAPDADIIQEYAVQLLKELSSFKCTVTYTHGYNGVRLGDCIELDYKRANIHIPKARIIQQKIECVPGCPVTETAEFIIKLWEDKVI